MDGTLSFQEVWFSPSHSPFYQLLHEQQPELATGFWHWFQAHDLTAISIRKDPYSIFQPIPLELAKKIMNVCPFA